MKFSIRKEQSTDKRPFLLYCFDEARFGRITGLQDCWAPKGVRPIVPAQLIREYTYVYGAVSPVTGDSFGMILPFVNAQCMNIFMNHLSDHYQEYHIILLSDQASWHTGHELIIPKNIHFLFLPPHSPELNPAEHIWDYMREHDMANKSFDSMDQLEDMLVVSMKKFPSLQDTFQSLCSFPWLLVNL